MIARIRPPDVGSLRGARDNAALRQQAADAFHNDIGIASYLRPGHAGDCTDAQPDGLNATDGLNPQQGGFEVSGESLDLVTSYTQNLAVPTRADANDPDVLRGKELLHQPRCSVCRAPSFVTHPLRDRPEHNFQLVWPCSDSLPHDMGRDLADALPARLGSGAEWRTPLLWGIGLTEQLSGHATFLHDRRARTLSEAILWHGGEGRAARDTFAKNPAPRGHAGKYGVPERQ